MSSLESYLDSLDIAYPPWQRDYFFALVAQHVKNKRAGRTPAIDLRDPQFRFFTDMNPAERAEYVFDLGSVEGVLRLEERAKNLKIAVMEMNGGLGSSLGLDPVLGHAKATGVTFSTAVGHGRHESISILEAKLLWTIRNANRFDQLGIIPWNSQITRGSWDQVLNHFFLDDRRSTRAAPRTYRECLHEAGIQLFDHEIQLGFPRLVAGTLEPVTHARPEDCFAPGGHGQILYQLYHDGFLARLSDEGYQLLILVNADSISAKPNPLIAALMIERGIPAALVTTDRTPIDAKGGINVVREGRLQLIERAQVEESQHSLFESLGLRDEDAPQPFNTNTVYVNIARFFDLLGEAQAEGGEAAIQQLLVPDLIVSRKRIRAEGKETIEIDQLEGAIGSVVLKCPGVKLFNVELADRTTEFAPVKKPYDVVYLFDSDAFVYDVDTGELHSCVYRRPAEFQLTGWSGWEQLDTTRVAFGHPSLAGLDSLTVDGEVFFPDAVFRGHVRIENRSGHRINLAELPDLPHVDGRLQLADVILVIGTDGRLTITPS